MNAGHDFALSAPVRLTLDVTGTGEAPPSFFADAELAIPGVRASIAFRARLLLACDDWSGFSTAVAGPEDAAADLGDLDGQLTLRFERRGGAASIRVEAAMPDASSTTSLVHETALDADAEAALRTAFQEFPVWW